MKEPIRDPEARLLAHLLDTEDEEQRQQMELTALEDDTFFDQLRAAEAELVDSYIRGDLEEPTSLRLADLIGRSSRLQESAETTLALHVRESGLLEKEVSILPTEPDPEKHQPRRALENKTLWGLLLIMLLLAFWQIVSMHRDLRGVRTQIQTLQENQRSLESEVQLLEREIERLRQEQLRLQRRWAEEAARDGQ